MNIVQLDKTFSASCLSYNLLQKKQQSTIQQAILICREFVIQHQYLISGSFAINMLLALHRTHQELSITVHQLDTADRIIQLLTDKLNVPIKRLFMDQLQNNVDRLTLFGEHIIEIVYLTKEEIDKIKAKQQVAGFASISVYYNLLQLHAKLVDAGRIFGRSSCRSYRQFSHVYCEKLLSILNHMNLEPKEPQQQNCQRVAIKKQDQFIKRLQYHIKSTQSPILYAKSALYFYSGRQRFEAYIYQGRPQLDVLRPVINNLLKPIQLYPHKCKVESIDIDGIVVNIYDNQYDVHLIQQLPQFDFDVVFIQELFVYLLAQYIDTNNGDIWDQYVQLMIQYTNDIKSVFYFGYNENVKFISQQKLDNGQSITYLGQNFNQ